MEYDYHSRVHKISPAGEVLWTVSQEVDDAERNPAQTIAVPATGGCIARMSSVLEGYETIIAFTSTGDAYWENSSFFMVREINIGEDGAVYVLDNNGLHKINANGVIEWTNTDVASRGYSE